MEKKNNVVAVNALAEWNVIALPDNMQPCGDGLTSKLVLLHIETESSWLYRRHLGAIAKYHHIYAVLKKRCLFLPQPFLLSD